MKFLIEIIEQSLESAIADYEVSDTWKSALGPSREKGQADVTLPCFVIAKELKRNPMEIASELAEKVNGEFHVSATGGYLNFKANAEWLVDKVLKWEKPSPNNSLLYTFYQQLYLCADQQKKHSRIQKFKKKSIQLYKNRLCYFRR